jgi:hypothetical protein
MINGCGDELIDIAKVNLLCAFFFAAGSQNDFSTSTSEFDRGVFADTGCSCGYERNFA